MFWRVKNLTHILVPADKNDKKHGGMEKVGGKSDEKELKTLDYYYQWMDWL